METIRDVLVLERGIWRADQIIVHQVIDADIPLHPEDSRAIEANWKGVLAKNPRAFAGPTIRFIGRHQLEDKLILEVVPSNYKISCLLGWLGVAMVPVTSDGYVALQGPVPSIAATIGGRIRVPGCTPEDANIISSIVREMWEEFGVRIVENQLIVLGLIEVRPPLAMFHHGLVVKVNLAQSQQEMMSCWEKAEDKWEGELRFVKIDYGRQEVLLSEIGGSEAINVQSLLILSLVIESEMNVSGYLNYWPYLTEAWRK